MGILQKIGMETSWKVLWHFMGQMVVFFQHFVAWKSFEICKLGIHKVGMNSTFQGILSLWFIRPWLLGHFLFGHEERYLKGTHLLGPWVDRLCIDLRPVGFCSTYICFFLRRDMSNSGEAVFLSICLGGASCKRFHHRRKRLDRDGKQRGKGATWTCERQPHPPKFYEPENGSPPLVEEEIPNLEVFLISGSCT